MATRLPYVSPSQPGSLGASDSLVLAQLAQVDKPHQIQPHQHDRGQLIYASHGRLQVRSGGSVIMVPTQFAAWIPPDVVHSVSADMPIEYCSLFVHPSACHVLPVCTQLLHLTNLLQELTREASIRIQDNLSAQQQRLHAVILDQLQELKPAVVALPLPASTRMQAMIDFYLSHPGDDMSIQHWSRQLSMSERSLTRSFKQDTGLTPTQWLLRLRVLRAIEWLRSGASIKTVSYELGYQQPSAFIAMFRKLTGITPGDYVK